MFVEHRSQDFGMENERIRVADVRERLTV